MAAPKLMVVAGPNKGATYFLQEGENTVGRTSDNSIVLANGQVSKKHCVFSVNGRKVELLDLGSSNGVFVNGVLVKKKILQHREKISVGPFVMEFLHPATTVPVTRPHQGVVMSSTANIPGMGASIESIDLGQGSNPSNFDAGIKLNEPQGIIGKWKRKFDDLALPVFYDMHTRQDWTTMLVVMFFVFVVINLGFTVYPILERSHEEVLREAENRAVYIANQITALNRNFIQENREANLAVDFAESDLNVKEAAIISLEGRIMAPVGRLNESYNNPFVLKYRDNIKRDQRYWKTLKFRDASEENVVVVSPVMVLSKAKGINVPGAISVVVFSTTGVSLDSGTVGVIYFEALCASLFLGVVFLYLLHQITMRPIQVLNDDMDAVLKGNIEAVEKKYQNPSLDLLIDTINSALSRIPKSDGSSAAVNTTDNEKIIVDNMIKAIEMMVGKITHPAMLLDAEGRVKFLNHAFEELTGIHGANALGDMIENVSRDQAFPGMIRDIMGKAAATPGEGMSESYEFSSGEHKITATAIGSIPEKVEAYLFVAEKEEG